MQLLKFLEQLKNNPTMQLWSGLPQQQAAGVWMKPWLVKLLTQGVHEHEWDREQWAVIFMDYHVPGILHFTSFAPPTPYELNEELEFSKVT